MKWLVFVVVIVANEIHGQTIESPCPSVFSYELVEGETDRWYGVVKLYTSYTLHGLWLNVMLDRKAHILGNWDAEVSTKDNIDFKIENPELKVNTTPVKSLRLFTKYDVLQGPPKVVSIRLNGREICNTDDPVPTEATQEATPEEYTPPVQHTPPQQQTSQQHYTPQQQYNPQQQYTSPQQYNPQQQYTPPAPPAPKPSSSNVPSYYNPPAPDPPHHNQNNHQPRKNQDFVTVVLPQEALARILGSIGSSQSDRQPYPLSTNVYNNQDNRDQYKTRGTYEQESNNDDQYYQCGKVYRSYGDNPNPLVVRGEPTLAGQWPWQVALYKTQRLTNTYHCGGTLVSKLHVITAGHCVTHKGSNVPLDKYTLTIYLGKHNLGTMEDGAQIKLVSDIFVHHDYDSNFFSKDVAILKLKEAVHLTQWVQPVCFWPEEKTDLSNILGKKGSVVGWGYNEMDQLNEELTLVEMPVVDELTCIRSKRKFFAIFTSEFTYCAGDRSGASVCNGDSGSGMVFKMQGIWYLRGLVSLSVPREDKPSICDPRHYIIFTDLAKFLPWIKEIVNKDNN